MHEDAILMEFVVPKMDLVNNFKVGTEMALGRANVTRSTKVETLQAFVMYMVGEFPAFSVAGVAGAPGPSRTMARGEENGSCDASSSARAPPVHIL
jgi:hypothetical protein